MVTQGYEDWFIKNQYQTERIFGDGRYYTAKAMAVYGLSKGMEKENIHLATGENFPDALSLGPLSGKNKGVLLLSSKDFLRKPTREFLTSYKDEIKEAFIAGGRDVFSYSTREEIKSILGL